LNPLDKRKEMKVNYQFDQNRKQVTTRSVQECVGCMKEVTKGTDAIYHTGKVDGGYYRFYLHLECHQFLFKHKEYLDKGVWWDCVNDIKREVSALSFFDENNI
jgi:hypothetical protein